MATVALFKLAVTSFASLIKKGSLSRLSSFPRARSAQILHFYKSKNSIVVGESSSWSDGTILSIPEALDPSDLCSP